MKLGLSGGQSAEDIKDEYRKAAASGGIGCEFDDKASDLFEVKYSVREYNNPPDTVAVVNTSPAHIIYYTPFPCMFAHCEALFQAKAGYAVEKHMGEGFKPLAKYGRHAIYYVVGHGNDEGYEMTCDCGACGQEHTPRKGLPAGDLWERMKADGLPENPAAIRLWVCRGADDPVGGGSSFAATFKMLLDFDNDDFNTERTSISSYSGYLTMTRNGGYSYKEKQNDATRVAAMERHIVIKKGTAELGAKAP